MRPWHGSALPGTPANCSTPPPPRPMGTCATTLRGRSLPSSCTKRPPRAMKLPPCSAIAGPRQLRVFAVGFLVRDRHMCNPKCAHRFILSIQLSAAAIAASALLADRATALRHVRPSTAALAAQFGNGRLDQIDRGYLVGQILRSRRAATAALPSVSAISSTTPDAEARLVLIHQRRQVLACHAAAAPAP